jgi:hypothetical protein
MRRGDAGAAEGRLRPHPGYRFRAHRVGNPDRKGRIERPFAYVETNFLVGRSFADPRVKPEGRH